MISCNINLHDWINCHRWKNREVILSKALWCATREHVSTLNVSKLRSSDNVNDVMSLDLPHSVSNCIIEDSRVSVKWLQLLQGIILISSTFDCQSILFRFEKENKREQNRCTANRWTDSRYVQFNAYKPIKVTKKIAKSKIKRAEQIHRITTVKPYKFHSARYMAPLHLCCRLALCTNVQLFFLAPKIFHICHFDCWSHKTKWNTEKRGRKAQPSISARSHVYVCTGNIVFVKCEHIRYFELWANRCVLERIDKRQTHLDWAQDTEHTTHL